MITFARSEKQMIIGKKNFIINEHNFKDDISSDCYV